MLRAAFEQISKAAERGDRITGISTGFSKMDEKTAGLHGGDLMIIAARPGMGKCLAEDAEITLSDGRVTHDAAFQRVDQRATENDRREGRRRAGERDFVDSWRYNVAAYEIAVLLGLGDMMPVSVERSYLPCA